MGSMTADAFTTTKAMPSVRLSIDLALLSERLYVLSTLIQDQSPGIFIMCYT